MAVRQRRSWLGAQLPLAALLALCACEGPRPAPKPSARFGVRWGGQLQARDVIPFELDKTKQTLGLEVELPTPTPRELPVLWELEMPDRSVREPDGTVRPRRRSRLGEGRLPAGQRRFEQTITLEPGDRLGRWLVRVSVDGQPVLERAVELVDPRTLDEDGRPRAPVK